MVDLLSTCPHPKRTEKCADRSRGCLAMLDRKPSGNGKTFGSLCDCRASLLFTCPCECHATIPQKMPVARDSFKIYFHVQQRRRTKICSPSNHVSLVDEYIKRGTHSATVVGEGGQKHLLFRFSRHPAAADLLQIAYLPPYCSGSSSHPPPYCTKSLTPPSPT